MRARPTRSRLFEKVQEPASRYDLRGRRADAVLVRPRNQRSKEELIVDKDHDCHRQDRPADRAKVTVFDRRRHVRADARELDLQSADRDRLRGNNKEPAARHRYHRVPNQAGHREGNLEAPKPLPAGQPKGTAHFFEIGWNRAQRLIEAKGHIPCLAREDCEDRRKLGAQHLSWKERDKKDDRERQIAKDRH
jgi:hypothetical protein